MFESRRVRIAALAAGAPVALLVVVLVALWIVQSGQVVPNTSVAGIEVSGAGPDEVRARLDGLVEERRTTPFELTFEGETYTLEPSELDYALDLDATVERALSRGREGLPGDLWTRLAAYWQDRDLRVVDGWDAEALDAWVTATADGIDREETLGLVEVDPDTLEVRTSPPEGLVEVEREELREGVVAGLSGQGPRSFPVPARTTERPLDEAVVEEAARRVERAVAEPLVLRVEEVSHTVERADLARLVQVEPTADEDGLELVVSEERVSEVLAEEVAATVDTQPEPAGYTRSRTPPRTFDAQSTASFSPVAAEVAVEDAVPGRRFDAAMAADQLTELVREGAREAQLRTETVEPELTTEDAEELRPSHLLGTFTTYHRAGQTRVANIQRLADVIDGATVLPDEQFSINGISGERACSKGYRPAGTIVQGELVDTCGGGVSQFGTTTFNAAFFSGVQLDQWKAHSWYISRYPMGREATLSYPQLDVKFTNISDAAILVKTDYSSTSITVSVYGEPIADEVTAIHGEPHNYRSYDTEVRPTSDLPRGQERVIQSGSNGFSVHVTRVVERVGGSTQEETIDTVYQPQTRIVERGTREASGGSGGSDGADEDGGGGGGDGNGGSNGGGDGNGGDDEDE